MTLAILPDLATDDRPCKAPGANPDAWFPEPRDLPAIRFAKALCAGCPDRAACLAEALARNEAAGIWGGLTTTERRGLPRQHPCRRCETPCALRFIYCSEACRTAARAASLHAYYERRSWSAA